MKMRQSDAEFDRELADLPSELRWREWMRRIEAVLFASASPVGREDLRRVVGQGVSVDLLVEDARQRAAIDPALWALADDARKQVTEAVAFALESDRQTLVVEAEDTIPFGDRAIQSVQDVERGSQWTAQFLRGARACNQRGDFLGDIDLCGAFNRSHFPFLVSQCVAPCPLAELQASAFVISQIG